MGSEMCIRDSTTIVPLRFTNIAQKCGIVERDGGSMSTIDIQATQCLPPTFRHRSVVCTESDIVIALGTSTDH